MVAIEGECNTHEYLENCRNTDKYSDYLPSVWRDITEEAMNAGHGGMDYIEFKAFFSAIKEGREMPLDVYDAASWMCITALSEASVSQGGLPQAIPDFTSGKWTVRAPADVMELPNPSK